MVLEAESLRPGCQHGWLKALFRVTDILLCPHVAEDGEGSLWSLSYKGTNPIWEGPHPHDSSTSQGPHLLTPSSLQVRISTCEFGGYTTIQIIASPSPSLQVGLALPSGGSPSFPQLFSIPFHVGISHNKILAGVTLTWCLLLARPRLIPAPFHQPKRRQESITRQGLSRASHAVGTHIIFAE